MKTLAFRLLLVGLGFAAGVGAVLLREKAIELALAALDQRAVLGRLDVGQSPDMDND